MTSLWQRLRARAAKSSRLRKALRRAPLPPAFNLYRPTAERDLLLASGLFDDAWYHDRYPDVPRGLDGATHYLQAPTAEKRQPSPLFDGVWYLEVNPDVAKFGMNPVIHYVNYGMHEGRAVRALNGDSNTVPLNALKLRPNVHPTHSIAVVIHAYYADIFDEICRLLPHIPGKFSLYVSVPNEQGLRSAQQSLARHRVNCSATIKVCQNRGRNFGPLLVEFADEVAKHDLVLHMHTKKSLYTGAEQHSWRDHLYTTLAGSYDIVRMTLDQFTNSSNLGVVYPSTTPTMPYWAHHWLSNSHLKGDLFARLGMPTPPAHGLLDYPVGGMFWARVEAIRPLLTARFHYDDFPPESGQMDGTLAHAIERCIVPLAQHRGYHFLDLDLDRGVAHTLRGGRNLGQYAPQTPEQLSSRIASADLVSFDIFDTLLLRPSRTPDSVLRFVGAALQWRYPAATEFFRRRKESENAAREQKQWAGDVDIDEIYACFPVDEAWTEEIIRHAHDLELQTEARIAEPRPAGIAALAEARKAGKRVIAISDTYLKRAFIERLLDAAGAETFDEMYISSERQARKDRGDLWALVMEREGIEPQRWLHIGDNEHSDIQLASDRGIGYFHLMNPDTLFVERGFADVPTFPTVKTRQTAKAADAAKWGTDLTLGPLVNQVAGDPFLPQHTFRSVTLETPWAVGHAVFGPMVFAFTAWMARHPAMRHLDHLYFLSREGYVLRRIYDQVRAYCDDLELPPSSYFLTSRRAALSAAQGRAFHPDALLSHADFIGTLASFLDSRLGLRLPERFGADDMRLELPRDRQFALDALQALEREITQHGTSELERYLRYGERMGITSAKPCGIVDIGYSGTIQTNLQTALETPLVGFYMSTFETIASVEKAGGYAYGCFSENRKPWTSRKPLMRYAMIMEAFLTAPQGQFNGFEESEAGLQPVYRRDTRSAHTLAILDELHEGAYAYCDELLRAYGSPLISASVDLDAIQIPLRMLGQGDLKVPADVARALVVDDDFTGSGEVTAGRDLVTITGNG